MLNARFVSDLHLTSLSNPRGQSFLGLLKSWQGPKTQAKPVTHLFLVGDIFDLWLADQPHFIDLYSPLIHEIERLKREGVEIHYFEGNHDLYLKSYWEDRLAIAVHEGPELFQLGPWKVWVEHGDEYDPDDKGYLFLRAFLRTSPLRFLAHHLPSQFVVRLGERASKTSRKYTDEVKVRAAEESVDRLRQHAQKVREQAEFDFLVNGHVHIVDDFSWQHKGKAVRAFNLGSWLKPPFGYLEITDSGPQMRYI